MASALGNTPWATYEAQLAQALASWENTAVSDEESYVSELGTNEETYATNDGSAYETEVSTLVSDDLSGSTGSSGPGASDTIASADQTLATKLAGDEQAFETADATATQTYQDAVAGDANVYQKAVNQAAHDLAVGAIDSAGYTSAVAAAAATQATNDATALAKFRTAESNATSTQVQNDTDAVQADANAVATAVHTAATADATAVHAYTLAESSAYYNEATGDADDLQTLEREEADGYEQAITAFEQAHPSPWSQELLAQAQAEQSRVDGVQGTTKANSYTGTAGAEDNLAHAQALATENQETADANAQETRDVSAADDAFALATATATADHTQQVTLATTDTNLANAGLAPLADGDGRAAPPPAAGPSAGGSGVGGGSATGGGGANSSGPGQNAPALPSPPMAGTAPTVSGDYGAPTINGEMLPDATGTFNGLVSGLFTAAPLAAASAQVEAGDAAPGTTPATGSEVNRGQKPAIKLSDLPTNLQIVPPAGVPATRPELLEQAGKWVQDMIRVTPPNEWRDNVEEIIQSFEAAGTPIDVNSANHLRGWIGEKQDHALQMEELHNALGKGGGNRARATSFDQALLDYYRAIMAEILAIGAELNANGPAGLREMMPQYALDPKFVTRGRGESGTLKAPGNSLAVFSINWIELRKVLEYFIENYKSVGLTGVAVDGPRLFGSPTQNWPGIPGLTIAGSDFHGSTATAIELLLHEAMHDGSLDGLDLPWTHTASRDN